MPLEPLPETLEALNAIDRRSDTDLTGQLRRQAELLEDVVPNLVGLSLALLSDGVTFTLAATHEHIALLDGIQYALGGPCVDAALDGSTVWGGDDDAGLLDEQRWAHFARASAARGVLSTLSLAIHDVEDRVVGGVNLYAATPNAFAGKEKPVAHIVGAWAEGAIHNADLTFSTAAAARRAPRVLEDMQVLDQATGVVVVERGVDKEQARRIIADAAYRAGQDQLAVAREMLQPFLRDEEGR
ncbi:hypothetical protein ACOCJ4_05560 [Knoellia sp. CPCC 206435]|uniref:hypothetical protein n=1 Tax=Knoellia terrae TaxID=3404797 RepID=UPI003B4339C1